MLKIFQTIAAFNYTFIQDYLVISKASLISGGGIHVCQIAYDK
jgi:hypothetical protein